MLRHDVEMTSSPQMASDVKPDAVSILLSATGRVDITDALEWIASNRPLRGHSLQEVLWALIEAERQGNAGATVALKTASRAALVSGIDTSATLLNVETIIPADAYDKGLAALVELSADGSLAGVSAAALFAVLKEEPRIVEIFAQVAGLSWRDLRERAQQRGERLPAKSDGRWRMQQLAAVVSVVDEVVTTKAASGALSGSVQAQPIELLTRPAAEEGWKTVERFRTRGVSYGMLLAQRDVGSSWGAHRNRSGVAVSRLLGDTLLDNLSKAGIGYWSTLGPRSVQVPREFLSQKAKGSADSVGQLVLVTKGRNGVPRLAVFLAIARDGGTARKTAATLSGIPGTLVIPSALLLAGGGWAERGETSDLVRSFHGRVFTDESIRDLVALAKSLEDAK
jgi:hypothetical protein